MQINLVITLGMVVIVLLLAGYSWNSPKMIFKDVSRQIIISIFLGLFFLGVTLIALDWGWDIQKTVQIVFSVFLGLSSINLIVNFLIGWKKTGKLLLDICPMPNRYVWTAVALVLFIMGFLGNLFHFLEMPYRRYANILFTASLAMGALLMAWNRLKIFKNGIWVYVRLRVWDDIESFEILDDDKAFVLCLKYKNRFFEFFRNEKIVIPLGKKKEVESLLNTYLSV